MSQINQRDEPSKETTNDQVTELRRCFGQQAIIRKDVENGGFLVQTRLENGRIPGGQRVELSVGEKNLWGLYTTNGVLINGVRSEVLSSQLVNLVFRPLSKDETEEQERLKKLRPDMPLPEDDTFWNQRMGMTFCRALKTSDHLAALYHEGGHALPLEEVSNIEDYYYQIDLFIQNERQRLQEMNRKELATYGYEGMREQAITYFKEEARGNRNGIQLIEYDRTVSSCDPFPTDTQLTGVKALFVWAKEQTLAVDPGLRIVLGKQATEVTKF